MNDQAGTLGSGNVVSAIKCQGDPVPVAVALLDRSWPLSLRLADAVGVNVAGRAALRGLEKDPRYLIGRFQQALTALLAADLPPMDAYILAVGSPDGRHRVASSVRSVTSRRATNGNATTVRPTWPRSTATTCLRWPWAR